MTKEIDINFKGIIVIYHSMILFWLNYVVIYTKVRRIEVITLLFSKFFEKYW